MKILTKKELLEAPAGTVYVKYEPEVTDGDIKIKVGNNCNLDLIPSFDWVNKTNKSTNWATDDLNIKADYDESDLFAAFNKAEVMKMINCLSWALADCKPYFNMDEVYYPGEETRLLFRFYPRKSRCYGKYSKPPKSWDEVYEVDYVWSIFSQYKDEGPNRMMNARYFECLGDENSIIGLIAEFCNILADGKEEYIWEDADGKTHITPILDHEHITFGDGVNWVIHKYRKTDYYEFSLWDFDNTGYRFTLSADRLKSFGKYLRRCCDYMLRHALTNEE